MKAYARARPADDSERSQIIVEHLDMARRIALRLARNTPSWVSVDDLIATATMGLVEAADRYDNKRSEPFAAFAHRRIRGAVLDELRRSDILPRRIRWKARRVGETIRELEQKFAREPEDVEIAEALGVSLEEYQRDLETLSEVSFVEYSDEDSSGLGGDAKSPATEAERSEMVDMLRRGLGNLQERDALVLSLYYNEEFTYAQIGTVLGISESRVCQLHARALARLRVELDQ